MPALPGAWSLQGRSRLDTDGGCPGVELREPGGDREGCLEEGRQGLEEAALRRCTCDCGWPVLGGRAEEEGELPLPPPGLPARPPAVPWASPGPGLHPPSTRFPVSLAWQIRCKDPP